MPATPQTLFTFCAWSANSGARSRSRDKWGMVFSRDQPWAMSELIDMLRHDEKLASVFNFPEKPVFIIPCGPVHRDITPDHNLARELPTPAVLHRYYTSRVDPGNVTEWLRRPRSGHFTGDDLAAPVQEWRYIVVPYLDYVLNRELHPSTLHHTFSIVWSGGVLDIRYKDLWDRCPIVNTLGEGTFYACAACDLRGIQCTSHWLAAYLQERDEGLQFEDLPQITPDNAAGADVASMWFRSKKVERTWCRDFPVDGRIVYIPPTKAIPLNRTNGIITYHDYTPANTVLDIAVAQHHTERYSERAQTAADTRAKHAQTCGTGATECVLKSAGCIRWRNSTCQTRFPDKESMVKAGFDYLITRTHYRLTDYQLAWSLAGHRFMCENPHTGRDVAAVYGGFHIVGSRVLHRVQWCNDPATTLFEGTWLAIRQFIRRHAPRSQAAFLAAHQAHTSVHIPQEDILLYAELASVHYLPSEYGMFGNDMSEIAYVVPYRNYRDILSSGVAVYTRGGGYIQIVSILDLARLMGVKNPWSWLSYVPS